MIDFVKLLEIRLGTKKNNRISADILKKIKHIEIYTRRLLSGSLVGDSRSALKGTGLEFDQIREYQFGDDIRFIDWKASARMDKMLVKQYIEERSRTIYLAVDVSQSRQFSSSKIAKQDLFAQIASVLALVSQYGKDRVGLILFSDEVEKYIPPGCSLSHVRNIMELLFGYQPRKKTTRVSAVLEHLLKLKKKDALVFLISDFIDEKLNDYLAQTASRYDLVAIRCLDDNEKHLPTVGFITIEDLETGQPIMLDMRKKSGTAIKTFLQKRIVDQDRLLKKYGVDVFDVKLTKHDFISDIVRFFRRRMQY